MAPPDDEDRASVSRVSRTKVLRWGVPLLLLAVLLIRDRQALAAATVEWTGFEKVGCCYFAPSLDSSKRAQVQAAWLGARQRVARMYGALRAQPRIVIADARTFPRFAAGTTGATHYLATGGSVTVLGPPGHNVDVIAHELAHAELLARVGFAAITWCVPTWFDEGLAVQFDDRPVLAEAVYAERSRSGWLMPPLAQLDTHAKFFAGTRDEVRFHYAGARVAVGRWLRSMSPTEARSSIASLDCSDGWKARLERIAAGLAASGGGAPAANPAF